MAILEKKGHRQICVIWIPKSMNYLAQAVAVEGNGSVFKDRALRVSMECMKKLDGDSSL